MFPGYTDTMHQANEFMELDDLFRAAAIMQMRFIVSESKKLFSIFENSFLIAF